jgi:putative transposase
LNQRGLVSIKRGSEFLGYTEQAYHKRERAKEEQQLKASSLQTIMSERIVEIRERMPKIGGEKLWVLLREELKKKGFGIGRDKFVGLYADLGFRLKKRKRRRKTTDSSNWHNQFADLRKDLIPTRPEQLMVGDITYIDTEAGDAYMPLITDAYSKMLMGYEVSHRMRAEECLVALRMAIKNRQYEGICIHHSDRGNQYISQAYTTVAHSNGFISSTTQDGSPYDNAVAERINRIIKEEFGFDGVTRKFKNAWEAKQVMKKVMVIYNKERPHMSNHMLTPFQMHQQNELPIKTWSKKDKRKNIKIVEGQPNYNTQL